MRWFVALVLLAGCDRVFGLGDPYQDARPADVAIDVPSDALADALAPADVATTIPRPLVHYRFDNSYGEAGGGTPATCTTSVGGNCLFETGEYGQALQLDGSSIGQVTLPSLPPVFTVMVWVKSMSGPVFDLPQSLTPPSPDDWWLDERNGFEFRSWSGTSTQVSTSARPIEQWTHVAVTYNGTTQTLYVDTNVAAITPVSAISYGANRVMCVGCRMAQTPTTYFAGAIDDLYVFDTELTQPEIAAYANSAH